MGIYNDKDVERMLKSVKVSDDHILLGGSVEKEFYGKKFIIRQIDWYWKWEKFVYWLGLFLTCYHNVCDALGLDGADKSLASFRKAVRVTLSNTVHGKLALRALCRMAGFFGFQSGWMKRHFKIDDYVELFIYVYIYNVIGVQRRLVRRVRSAFKSPVELRQTKTDIFSILHKDLKFTEREIKGLRIFGVTLKPGLTTLQVNLHLQRMMEPVYKAELDAEIQRIERASEPKTSRK
jgi:hypothetical protein